MIKLFLVFILFFQFVNAQIDSTKLEVVKLYYPDSTVQFDGTTLNNQFWTGSEYRNYKSPVSYYRIRWFNGIQQDSLRSKIQPLYLDVLKLYFVDTIGNNDISKFGFLVLISNPHSFEYRFQVNNKPFKFDNPPYHELLFPFGNKKKRFLNKGRKLYFIYDNITWINENNLPDTLKIDFFEYTLTGIKELDANYRNEKKLIKSYFYVVDRKKINWTPIEN